MRDRQDWLPHICTTGLYGLRTVLFYILEASWLSMSQGLVFQELLLLWSGFQVAKKEEWVTGNYNSRRWHSSKYDTSTTGQDWTFAKNLFAKADEEIGTVLRKSGADLLLWGAIHMHLSLYDPGTRHYVPFKTHTWMRKRNVETILWKNPMEIFVLTLSNKWKRNTIFSKQNSNFILISSAWPMS